MFAAFVLLLTASTLPLAAVTVRQMNLEEMVDNADKIFRGTVLDVRETTVNAGGGELPVVVYRLRVDESFKGSYQTVKGIQVAEVRMLGKLKTATSTGSKVRFQGFIPELPNLQVGHDYLLLTTASSAIGLSTTVGLGQGRFELSGKAGQEVAINGNNNRGLFGDPLAEGSSRAAAPPEGPLPYTFLANTIRGLVG
ncbi:MAG TPA: hypothetical protein VEL74_17860 [Thermoanaerobaculia bacterium]|nr:hypothetical protein [Thermoanaerobaculia bacterium]